MKDIKNYDTFVKIEEISKGYSKDKKYYIETNSVERLLLRLSDISNYARKKSEFETMSRVACLGIPMPQPVDFGICDGGNSVYQLLTWCDGKDAEAVLPMMCETEQYTLGVQAGQILRKIHTVPVPDTSEEYAVTFERRNNHNLREFEKCGICFEELANLVAYLKDNRSLISNRQQSLIHNDYHNGNMMINNGKLIIIDFNDCDCGDPWEEFVQAVWQAQYYPHFSTGQVRGYFDGEPPEEFWQVLAYYTISHYPTYISWAKIFSEDEINKRIKQAQDFLKMCENTEIPVPAWYLKDFYIQYTDGVPYKLKAPFDFSFLKKYGEVFKVFDDQDSGNICFGVVDNGKRYFVKFAGAPAKNYISDTSGATERLKASVQVYRDLEHSSLIHMICAEEIGGGFAVIFDWVDAVCMHRMYPADHVKFKQVSTKYCVRIFEDILNFHKHAAEKGYVSIDFYDGSIMWDFENERTVICDIDFYSKTPWDGNAELWGCSRFAAPEERVNGGKRDEITNVYNMGATAFALFSDGDRLPEKWPLDMALYDVVKKAISDERCDRQQSITQLINEWNATKEMC